MIEVLKRLCTNPGFLGTLVATKDGIVVLSHLQPGMDDEASAALVSSLLSSTKSLLGNVGLNGMEQIVLRASRGKIIVSDLGVAYLVVVADRNLDLDAGMIEIKSASKVLSRLGRITV
ncbi:MAG TPA: roadblock/LC7 domain-containing protein [Planctomycetota bacterium]|jgi:predicted regulator of Ras-like GTPase activity (Roadblock/LC7/MglB family)|nr:roadblock/LC7 domain-containing protein [Planctomycetota bacterium]